MLRGFFQNNCPYIKLIVVGSTGEKEITALLDTGFNGYLTLPESDCAEIGLERVGVGSSTVADGSSSPYIDYRGKAICNGERIIIDIESQPKCKILFGMSLLKELHLNLFVDIEADRVE